MRRLLALSAVLLVAADWPQWLGPNRDASSVEIVKPWKDDPKVLWRVPVGDGHSSPVVAAGRVYLMDKVPEKDAERIRDWDARTGQPGKYQVDTSRGPFASPFGTGPRATPVVVGNSLYAVGVTGDLHIRQFGKSETKESVFNLLERYHAPNLKFGISAAPLVEGNKLIVPVGGKGVGVVALDRENGELVWKALDDPACYSAPILIDHGGQPTVVAQTAHAIVGLAAKDGTELWRFPFRDLIQESSVTPVKVGDLIIVSSVTLGSVGLKLTAKDGKPAVEQAWKNPQLTCYFSTPVAVGKDHVYMVVGSLAAAMVQRPQADLCCVEVATGKLIWKHEKVGKYHAALLRTGDNKLLMHCDTGDLVLLDPDPKAYRELCRSKVCGDTWAHPALADGRLYVRDDKELICLRLE